jgi:predicted DNA-binding transcriptional regulator AlpA
MENTKDKKITGRPLKTLFSRDSPEWLSITKAHEISGESRQTIYNAIKDGRIRSREIGGRTFVFL